MEVESLGRLSITAPPRIGPPGSKIAGMFNRAAAIIMPGTILSQEPSKTIASRLCARTIISTLLAMISRVGRIANIPSPCAMPSQQAIVPNSTAVPPAA